MKPGPQYLMPRQAVVYHYTERMLRETGTNRRTFGMVVADRYLQMVAEDDRDVPFRLTKGAGAESDKKHNGQIIGRFLDGVVKKLPADLEDVWVLSLPDPYRTECERDLARRRGMLAVPIPVDGGIQVASVAELMGRYGDLLIALGPAIENGSFGPEDLPFKHRINVAGDDVIAAVLGVRRELEKGVSAGAPGA